MIKYIYRSAITGRIVNKKYALKHPETTVKETMTIAPRGNKARLKKNQEIINRELRARGLPL